MRCILCEQVKTSIYLLVQDSSQYRNVIVPILKLSSTCTTTYCTVQYMKLNPFAPNQTIDTYAPKENRSGQPNVSSLDVALKDYLAAEFSKLKLLVQRIATVVVEHSFIFAPQLTKPKTKETLDRLLHAHTSRTL